MRAIEQENMDLYFTIAARDQMKEDEEKEQAQK